MAFQQFSFRPDSQLFNRSFGGGVQTGSRLVDIFNERKQRSRLAELEERARAGLNTPEDFNALGSALIGLGDTRGGLAAINTPFNREQQALEQNRQAQQQAFLNSLASRRIDIAERPPLPPGFTFNDPNNPQAGVTPLPGLPTARPKARTPIAKINQDFEDGLISAETRDKLIAIETTPKNGIEVITNPDGTTTTRIGGKGKSATESQSNANIFASRGEVSNATLNKLETEGTDLVQTLVGNIPIAGNFHLTPEFRQYKQAQRDFINAILRKESGAAIAPSEFENAMEQYFPQPGDDPQTIAQKKRNRQVAIRAIRQASGPFANTNANDTGPAVQVANPDQPVGTLENPVGVSSEAEAEALPKGTYVIIDGRIGIVE